MQFKTRLFIFSAMAFSLASCSSGYDKSSSATNDKPQELAVSAVYYSVTNDINPTLSNRIQMTTLLNQKVTEKNTSNYVFLGHSVATICQNDNDCSQASNLTTLDYIVKEEQNGLVIHGQMMNETGKTTTSKSQIGHITWSISEGAKLHTQGVFVKDFSFPIKNGSMLTIEGKLGDKLVLSAANADY